MAFCFRIRFQLGARVSIDSPETHLLLTGPNGEEVRLQPTAADTALKDASDLALRGYGYDDEAEAAAAADRWRGLVQKAFARVNLGADFGDRAPHGHLTEAGLEFFGAGHRVLNDVHGTLVFECEPPPMFGRVGGRAIVGVTAERLMNALDAAIELGAVMSDRDQVAYDLYSASFSERPRRTLDWPCS